MNDFCIFYFHNSKSVKICLFNDATNGPKSSKIDKSFGKCVPSFAVTTRILVFESFFLPTNDDFPPVDRSTESSSFKKYKKTQTKSCPKQKKHLGRLGTQRDQIYKNLKVSGLLKGLFGKYGQSFTREHSLIVDGSRYHCMADHISSLTGLE